MSLGPSPLYAAVALEWPYAVQLPDAAVVAELTAWLEHEDAGGDLARVVIDTDEIRVWRQGPPDPPFVWSLRSHPSAALLAGLVAARVLTCAATVIGEDGAERWRCNVLVDAYGRHTGPHADGRYGDGAEWPNMNDADQPPPAPPAPPIQLPTRAQIRVVLGLALDLCNHLPDAADTCPYCPKIRRATDAVLAMIGAPS